MVVSRLKVGVNTPDLIGSMVLQATDSLFGLKLVFSSATDRAHPSLGQTLKRGAGRNIVFRIPLGGVVDKTANAADILFHIQFSFLADCHY